MGAPAPVPATYNSSTVLSSFLPVLADGDFPFTNGHAHDGDVRSVRGPRSGEGSPAASAAAAAAPAAAAALTTAAAAAAVSCWANLSA